MLRRVVVSAPGKVIIHGEHAVVYGKRALAASLGLRTELTLLETCDRLVLLQLPDVNVTAKWQADEFSEVSGAFGNSEEPKAADADVISLLKKMAGVDEETNDMEKLALVAFLYLFCSIAVKNRIVPSVSFDVHSLLPLSAGLGSSASYSVCLAAGLLLYAGKVTHGNQSQSLTETDLDLINQWAFMAEKVIHGRPSGIDNCVSTYGGALFFQGGSTTPLKRMPHLRILIVNTKVRRSTKVLVESVRKKHDKYPDIVKPILDSIEGITSKFESLLNKEFDADSYEVMKDLIEMNQQLLVFLGVSHPALDDICQITAHFGLHSKLTGAGGGGCAFTLIPKDINNDTLHKVMSKLSGQGYDCFETAIGGQGVVASVDVVETFVN